MGYYLFTILFFLAIGSHRLVIKQISLYEYGTKFEKIIFLLSALFLCGGYMTGSDWRTYELLYYKADWNNLKYYLSEQLFYVLIIVSKYIIHDFFIFLIICKLLVFYIIYRFFKKYSPNIFLSYFFYIPLFGIFLFIDNPLRYMIALGFITLSYKFILSQNFLKFILVVFLGSLFHYTVIIFIPFYFLKKIPLSRVLLSIIFIAWMLLFSTDHLLYIIDIFSNYIPIINSKFLYYLIKAEEVKQIFSLGLIINIVFFFWIIANKNQIENNLNHGQFFYSMSIIYLFLTKFSVIFPSGFRFTYLFAPIFVITLTFLFSLYRNRLKQIFTWGIVLYIFLFTIKKIDNQYVYTPYSNYIISIATDNWHQYSYRENYNIKRYIDRNGHSPED
ncbi:MAG TPA: EpsG family protein [Prolixibacteraceae bacterium]|nr:EpsG family protein [Prolixibacteraceae bacterium]